MIEIPDWAKEVPDGVGASQPERMSWPNEIATAFYLMDEKNYSRAEARKLIIEKEGLNRKQAESFMWSFNRYWRLREQSKN